jgi:hypothetical protein
VSTEGKYSGEDNSTERGFDYGGAFSDIDEAQCQNGDRCGDGDDDDGGDGDEGEGDDDDGDDDVERDQGEEEEEQEEEEDDDDDDDDDEQKSGARAGGSGSKNRRRNGARRPSAGSQSLEAEHGPLKRERRHPPAPVVVGLGGANPGGPLRRRFSGSMEPISPSLIAAAWALSKEAISPKRLEKVDSETLPLPNRTAFAKLQNFVLCWRSRLPRGSE